MFTALFFALAAVAAAKTPTASASLPVAAAADGTPELPAVVAMVGSAEDTVKIIAAQAKSLQVQVMQMESDNEANIAKQRAIYEHQLKKQNRANRAMNATNQVISNAIAELKASNDALKKKGKELGEANNLTRNEIMTLASKVGMSNEFLATALESTDDSQSPELVALHNSETPSKAREITAVQSDDQEAAALINDKVEEPAAPHLDDHKAKEIVALHKITNVAAKVTKAASALTDEEADKDAEDDADDDKEDSAAADEAESFLALRQHRHRVTNLVPASGAADLVVDLSKGVQNFAAQAKKSEADLKAAFEAQLEAGKQLQVSLLEEQKKLNATRSEFLLRSKDLSAADAHLEDTQQHMKQRLRGFGTFMQRLAHVALAPESMAPKLMNDLPGTIAIPVNLSQGGQP